MTSRIRAWGSNLLLAVFSIAVTLAGFEGALRVFLPQKLYRFPRGMFRNDPELVFGLSPGFEGTLRNPEYTTRVRINSLGLRGPEPGPKREGALRVLVLGDSFVSAFNVEEGETFLAAAEETVRPLSAGADVDMVNAGTPNYGTWHELRMFRRLAGPLRADAAVLCVYVGNDVENNLSPSEAIVEDGLLVARRRQPGIIPYPLRSWLQRNSMSYVLLWNGWNQVRPLLGRAGSDPLRPDKDLVSPVAARYLEDGYGVTLDLLRQFRDEAKSLRIPVLVVLIPAEFQVYTDGFERSVRRQGVDPTAFDLDLPQKRWREMARQLDLKVLDLLPVFRSHSSGPYLYMSLDGHLTVEGNHVAGEALGRALAPELGRTRGAGERS